MILGIVIGAMKLKMPLARQFAIAIAVVAATTLLLPFVGSVPMLALALFTSGVAISPTFITAFGLVERRVPPAKLTEGITWVSTGIGIGMAIGSFASGSVIDAFGASNGFWVSVAAGAIAVATALAGYCTLSASPRGAGLQAAAA